MHLQAAFLGNQSKARDDQPSMFTSIDRAQEVPTLSRAGSVWILFVLNWIIRVFFNCICVHPPGQQEMVILSFPRVSD